MKYIVFAGVLVESGRAYQKGQIIEGLEENRVKQLVNAGLIIEEAPAVVVNKDMKAAEKKVIEAPEFKKEEAPKASEILKAKKKAK